MKDNSVFTGSSHALALNHTPVSQLSEAQHMRPKQRQKNTSSQTKPVISHHKKERKNKINSHMSVKGMHLLFKNCWSPCKQFCIKCTCKFLLIFFFCKQISAGDRKKSTESSTKIKAKHSLIVTELSLPHTLEAETLSLRERKWQELDTWKQKIEHTGDAQIEISLSSFFSGKRWNPRGMKEMQSIN